MRSAGENTSSKTMEPSVIVSTEHHGTVQYHKQRTAAGSVHHSASTHAIHDYAAAAAAAAAADPDDPAQLGPAPVSPSLKRHIGRRHSSAAILPSPPSPGAEHFAARKTVTSYSFRERSPKKNNNTSSASVTRKLFTVRFHSSGDDKPSSPPHRSNHHHQREQHDDDDGGVKQVFLSVPTGASNNGTSRRSSTVQWSDERFEMTVMGSRSSAHASGSSSHSSNCNLTSPTSGWRRSASSLKSPTRATNTAVAGCRFVQSTTTTTTTTHQQAAYSTQHTRSQSMRVGYKPSNYSSSSSSASQSQKDDDRRRTLLQVPTPHRPRGTSLPSHRVLIDASSSSQAFYGGGGDGDDGGGDDPGDYYLIRQFIVHGKSNKVVNRGDSLRKLTRNPALSNASLCSSSGQQQQQQQQSSSTWSTSQLYLSFSGENGSVSPTTAMAGSTLTVTDAASSSSRRASQWTVQQQQQQQASEGASALASASSPSGGGGGGAASASPEPLRVVMLGASGVGKTALTAQFMTSEYLNTYEASLDDDACDRCVSVLLDGQESQLVFIDHPHGEISVENCMSTYNPHAYVIVYSVVDAESVRTAEETLHFLWRHNNSTSASTWTASGQQMPAAPPVVILVANKSDLVRSRVVTPQAGKSLATSFDCKYIETSSGMQHNVDELLVGILKQIRLKMLWHQQVLEHMSSSSSGSVSSTARSLFRKRSGRRKTTSKPDASLVQQQQDGANQSAEVASVASQEGLAGGLIGSVVDCCGIVSSGSAAYSAAASLSLLPSSVGGLKLPAGGQASSSSPGGWSPNGAHHHHHRRSASLRVRKMLGKAVWTCADYYGSKSRSCEDLHVL